MCSSTSDAWLDKLFDLSKCRCDIPSAYNTFRGKLLCKCEFDVRVPENVILLLKDQRSTKQMFISASKDMNFHKRKQQAAAKTRWIIVTEHEQFTTS